MEFVQGEAVRSLHKQSFFELSTSTFGLQFEEWDALGYWDEKFSCYAAVDEGRVVANVSVSYATMLLDGQAYTCAQIGTVMTDPRYQGQGLSKELMNRVMADVQTIDIVYLFANASVLSFYPKFGFEKRTQATFTVQTAQLPAAPQASIEQLDMNDAASRALLYDYIVHRAPISSSMAIVHNENIVMFHALMKYRQNMYYVKSFDAIVIAVQNDETFQLIDVIAKEPVELEALLAALDIQAPSIALCFTPPALTIPVTQGVFEDSGAMFVKEQGAVHYPNDKLYPYSALA